MRKILFAVVALVGAAAFVPVASVATSTPASAQIFMRGPFFGFGFGPYYGYPYYNQPYYGPTYPRVYAPGYLRTWSPEWYSYCSSRYRSFNPRTGLYKGYDGKYHLCT